MQGGEAGSVAGINTLDSQRAPVVQLRVEMLGQAGPAFLLLWRRERPASCHTRCYVASCRCGQLFLTGNERERFMSNEKKKRKHETLKEKQDRNRKRVEKRQKYSDTNPVK